MKRPECPPLKVGDKVMVLEGTWGGPRRGAIPAVVSGAARVWLTIEDVSATSRYPRTWRMRRDTQNEGNTTYPQGNARFVTPEQYEYDQRIAAVSLVIRDAKVRLDDGFQGPGRIWTDAARVALADLIISLGILTEKQESEQA